MSQVETIKEGWLHKRGEHIKTWRSRYFVLKSNGHFLGFNCRPSIPTTSQQQQQQQQQQQPEPNNTFYIKNCKIIKSDKPKPNVFVVRCFSNENTLVERYFASSNAQEREDWIKSIEKVSQIVDERDLPLSIRNTNLSITKKFTLHDFEFLKTLGKGTFGKVILCREKSTSSVYAMKILKKSLIIEKNEIAHTKSENTVMRTLKHPFTTELFCSFQTSEFLCLVMEYVSGGELFFHLTREKRFSEDKARFYCAEICYAIGFLHDNNVVYRDLKLENILIDNEGHIKLADFGLCKMNMNESTKTETFCGTLEYLAPEIVMRELQKEGYTRAIDWWSIGIVLYEMLLGRLPFSAPTRPDLFARILTHDPLATLTITPPEIIESSSSSSLGPIMMGTVSEPAHALLTELLRKDPRERLSSFESARTHLFFASIDWNRLSRRELEPPFRPTDAHDIHSVPYFESEFTRLPIELTPPLSRSSTAAAHHHHSYYSMSNVANLFDSFSYYGSSSSSGTGSRASLSSQSQTSACLTSDRYDAAEILGQEIKLFNTNPRDSKSTFLDSYRSTNNRNNTALESRSFLSLNVAEEPLDLDCASNNEDMIVEH